MGTYSEAKGWHVLVFNSKCCQLRNNSSQLRKLFHLISNVLQVQFEQKCYGFGTEVNSEAS